ncbi:hypothetical protein IAQ61_006182 [Plenodomus lingam]|uniref:Predicted protein n=1 Tax=Leptosphaeria maculans (strain JN3 / isolate v23.1.3 / race Av1-4-5-6-7-8) TaxID=985895 RepID=E4ZM74_LEPMJ|nr:predicted protein [Plenodomus lingam JN3]KAH9870704.1 hypothetical protein IAQ61_006182 [Plenodomus lingam]CBX92423.1 predicted protein [Plenodomus lingam JN3]
MAVHSIFDFLEMGALESAAATYSACTAWWFAVADQGHWDAPKITGRAPTETHADKTVNFLLPSDFTSHSASAGEETSDRPWRMSSWPSMVSSRLHFPLNAPPQPPVGDRFLDLPTFPSDEQSKCPVLLL